ncbi:hemolysin XhlA family protein, partial [Melissococcus plutonius]
NARTALARSEENTRDIEEMKENQKWTWRTVVGIGVSIFVYLATTYLGRK